MQNIETYTILYNTQRLMSHHKQLFLKDTLNILRQINIV